MSADETLPPSEGNDLPNVSNAASPQVSVEEPVPVKGTTAATVEDDQSEGEETPRVSATLTPMLPQMNIQMTGAAYSSFKKPTTLASGNSPEFVRLDDFVALPPASIDDFNATVLNYPNVNLGDSPEGAEWLTTMVKSELLYPRAGAFEESISRTDSMWRQSVNADGEELRPGRPKFGTSSGDGARLTGEQAMLKMNAVLGLGFITSVPLWHTGMWISLKAPSEASLLELDRRIASEKVYLGRQTNGLVFSATSVYTTGFLVDFALEHVYEVSYQSLDRDALKAAILTPDIPLLLWGLLTTIYPNGYPFKKSCNKDPTVCRHVVEEILNLGKLLFTDERSLTEKQRRHMTQRNTKFKDADLKAYQAEHRYHNNGLSVLQLTPALTANLQVPTIAEAEVQGRAWVDGIVMKTDQVFASKMSEAERQDYIVAQSQVTSMQQYVPWVRRLVLSGSEVIEDRETLAASTATLSSNAEIYQAFFDGMGKFINATTISLIAIPRISCPKCEKPMDEEYVTHPNLIPLEVPQLFFTITGQRITKVLSR